MSLANHFFQFAESYTVLFAWIVVPLSYFSFYLWIKNNSIHFEMPTFEAKANQTVENASVSETQPSQSSTEIVVEVTESKIDEVAASTSEVTNNGKEAA